jgi:hypothetical protein
MQTYNHKLLTIYTEAALESSLIRQIDTLGASGYTITNARGKGSSGSRTAFWEANSNIRVEIMCTEEIATLIVGKLHEKYAKNYALMTFTSDIIVSA